MGDMPNSSPTKPWAWWWSADEERYRGPCDTRGEAIREAWSEGQTGSVFIMQATQNGMRTDIIDDDWLCERFDDANEDYADPDGDPLSAGVKQTEWIKLAEALNHRIAAFVREQGLHSWAFGETARQETVDLAAMGFAALDDESRPILAEIVSCCGSEFTSDGYLQGLLRDLQNILRAPAKAEGSAQ